MDAGIAKIWAEYGGLIGLIVLALFVLVLYLIREHKETVRGIVSDSKEQTKHMSDQHRTEREEWRKSDRELRRETNDLVKGLMEKL